MKKVSLTLAIIFLMAGLQAQEATKLFSTWKLKSFGIALGVEQDRIMNFSGNSFVRMSGYEDLFTSRGIDVNQLEKYGGLCENPHLRLQAIFQPGFSPNWEVHTALVAMINRVDGISYYSDDYLQDYNDYLTLDAWGSEVATELAFIRRLNLGPVSIYGGLGTNLGVHFANELSIYGGNIYTTDVLSFSETGVARFDITSEEEGMDYLQDYRSLSAGISQRIFAQGGASLTFLKRLELGIEGRYGYGYRLHFDGQALGTNLHSFALFGRWNLK